LKYSFHIDAIGGTYFIIDTPLEIIGQLPSLPSSITLGLLSLIASDSGQLLDLRGIQLGCVKCVKMGPTIGPIINFYFGYFRKTKLLKK
jgi:hypothetical protein